MYAFSRGKEDRIRTIANRFAIRRPGKISTLLRFSQISWWWICECSAVESSRGCVGVVAAVLVSVSANYFPGISLWSGTHRRVVGPGQALLSDLRW